MRKIWSRVEEGGSRKKLIDAQIDDVALVESDPCHRLQQLSDRVAQELEIRVSKSTIGNYFEWRVIILKRVHAMPANMNTDVN